MSYLGEEINYNIRWYKPNDPYYWEVDNLPIEDLQSNCIKLQSQVNTIPPLASFITEPEASNVFLDKTVYENRRFSDLGGVSYSTLPAEDFVFLRTLYDFTPDNLYTQFKLKVGHQEGSTNSRGLEDISISGPITSPQQVLKWRSGVDGGKWVAETDKHYDKLFNHLDAEQSGNSISNNTLVQRDGNWTNVKVTPMCSEFTSPAAKGLLAWSDTADRFTNRDLDVTVGYPNIPGQSGFFPGNAGRDGANLLGGTDSSMDPSHYGTTWLSEDMWDGTGYITVGTYDTAFLDSTNVWGNIVSTGTGGTIQTGPSKVPWMNRMNTNTQGTADNWTAVNGLVQKEIILNDNSDIAGRYPPGITHLHVWVWIRQTTDVHDDMSVGTGANPITNAATKRPRAFVSFLTGHKDDANRKCQAVAGITHINEEANSGPMNHEEGEFIIPVSNKGARNGTGYTYDGKDRVYLDMHSWNLAAVLHATNYSVIGTEQVPSFFKIRVDGWVT